MASTTSGRGKNRVGFGVGFGLWCVAGLAVGLLAGPVMGQSGKQPGTTAPGQPAKGTQPPAQNQPNQPAQPGKTGSQPAQAPKKVAPQPGPYVTLEQEKDLTLRINVLVRLDRSSDRTGNNMPDIRPMTFKTLTFVFPVLEGTASFRPGSVFQKRGNKDPEGEARPGMVKGELYVNDQLVSKAPTLLTGDYPSGVRLGRWNATDMTAREVELKLEIAGSVSRTKFDEKAALKVGWPGGEWPKEAAATFKPELYIDHDNVVGQYDMTIVKDAVKRWTKGNPRSVPPVTLAKYIAGEVVSMMQTSGDGLTYTRESFIEGIGLVGAPEAMRLKRGSEFDLTCVLAACYREAGLPARTVIGYARAAAGERENFLNKRKEKAELRSWVEFCLYDEANNTINWVPVDPARMRKKSSRPPALDRPWMYFGEHSDLNEVVPFALQFHPPTTVLAYGSPGFWGWLVTPQPPAQAYQSLQFDIFASSTTGKKDEETKPNERPNQRK